MSNPLEISELLAEILSHLRAKDRFHLAITNTFSYRSYQENNFVEGRFGEVKLYLDQLEMIDRVRGDLSPELNLNIAPGGGMMLTVLGLIFEGFNSSLPVKSADRVLLIATSRQIDLWRRNIEMCFDRKFIQRHICIRPISTSEDTEKKLIIFGGRNRDRPNQFFQDRIGSLCGCHIYDLADYPTHRWGTAPTKTIFLNSQKERVTIRLPTTIEL